MVSVTLGVGPVQGPSGYSQCLALHFACKQTGLVMHTLRNFHLLLQHSEASIRWEVYEAQCFIEI